MLVADGTRPAESDGDVIACEVESTQKIDELSFYAPRSFLIIDAQMSRDGK